VVAMGGRSFSAPARYAFMTTLAISWFTSMKSAAVADFILPRRFNGHVAVAPIEVGQGLAPDGRVEAAKSFVDG
jgi:hypothetical protein